MIYQVVYHDRVIGTTNLEFCDLPMCVSFGAFHYNKFYLEIRLGVTDNFRVLSPSSQPILSSHRAIEDYIDDIGEAQIVLMGVDSEQFRSMYQDEIAAYFIGPGISGDQNG